MRGYLYVLLVAAAVTYVTTPAARRVARRIGAISPIRDRDVHTVPTPRLGGTALLLGIVVALISASRIPFFSPVFTAGRAPFAVLLGAVAVCLLGVADDVWGLDAITKMAGQALAAGAMAWQGVQLVFLPTPHGIWVPSPGLLIMLTVLAVVITINAVNFVDGLDGLAAGIVAISGAAFFTYSYLLSRSATPDDYSSLATLTIAALVGACVGFLPHNFHPARIFMGDSGSMLIGLLLASSTLSITASTDPEVFTQGRIVPAFLPIALPIAVLALPLMDLGLAVVRRTRAGKMFWKPDKMHLHHRMLALGHSHTRAVLLLYVWTATLAFGVASAAFIPPLTSVAAALVAVTVVCTLTFGPLRGRRRRVTRATPGPPGTGGREAADRVKVP